MRKARANIYVFSSTRFSGFNFWRWNDLYTTNCQVCGTKSSRNSRRCRKHERTPTYTAVRYVYHELPGVWYEIEFKRQKMPKARATIYVYSYVLWRAADIVTGSRMNCRVTTVEGLPSSTGLNSSWQVFQHSIIGVPLPGVASSARQDTGNESQHEYLHIPRNPTVTNSTDRRISSQHTRDTSCKRQITYMKYFAGFFFTL